MKREIVKVSSENIPKPRFTFEANGFIDAVIRFEANSNMPTREEKPLESGYFFEITQGTKGVWFSLSDEEMQLLFLAYQESRQWMIEQSR